MKILFVPQVNEVDTLIYEFVGDKIVATFNNEVDEFDFTDMPDGAIARSYGRDPEIISTISINPVIEVKREKGVLYATLLNFITLNATEEEKFPKWIEINNEEVESNG